MCIVDNTFYDPSLTYKSQKVEILAILPYRSEIKYK